jgi:nicotinamidase-related amidase
VAGIRVSFLGPRSVVSLSSLAREPLGAGCRRDQDHSRYAPFACETIVDKPGKGAFYATDLELILRQAGIRNLVLTGITTDVCVHTTMREANDRGFECLLLSDCCGATDFGNHQAAVKMIKMQGGVFGSVSDSNSFEKAITPPLV